jgi:predicted nucleic acid-binding Zn ribbon protein
MNTAIVQMDKTVFMGSGLRRNDSRKAQRLYSASSRGP